MRGGFCLGHSQRYASATCLQYHWFTRCKFTRALRFQYVTEKIQNEKALREGLNGLGE